MNMHNSLSRTSHASSFPEEGQPALDGSEPAAGDEIRELQQIGNPERLSSHYLIEYLCGLNHRSWENTRMERPSPGRLWLNCWDAFRSSPINSAWVHTGRFAAMTARISWPRGPSTLISLRKPTVPTPQAVPVRQTVQRKSSDSRYLA